MFVKPAKRLVLYGWFSEKCYFWCSNEKILIIYIIDHMSSFFLVMINVKNVRKNFSDRYFVIKCLSLYIICHLWSLFVCRQAEIRFLTFIFNISLFYFINFKFFSSKYALRRIISRISLNFKSKFSVLKTIFYFVARFCKKM